MGGSNIKTVKISIVEKSATLFINLERKVQTNMQLKNYYRKLANLTEKHNLKWRLSRNGKIRCNHNSRCHCPITLVINTELGRRVNVSDARNSAYEIGLSYYDATTVMEAADFPSSELDAPQKLSRAALLRATGLV